MSMIRVNSTEIMRLKATLSAMHRSALPNVVRFSLNDLAFLAKKDTLKKSADKFFINRTKTFFKAHSGVAKATGYNVDNMESEVGMRNSIQASKNMAIQEKGGAIKDRQFIPQPGARRNGEMSGRIPASKFVKKTDYVNANKVRGRGRRKTNLPKALAIAKKKKIRHVKYLNSIFRVKGIKRSDKGFDFEGVSLYTYKKGRVAKITRRPFMRTAGEMAYRQSEQIFKRNFDRQIEKLKSKGRL